MKPRRFHLPLGLRLLAPVIVVALATGPVVTWILVRDVARRADAGIEQQLFTYATHARALLHERELYVLEAAHFAANLQGMAAAVERRDRTEVERLLRSVLALKHDLAGVAIVDRNGRVVAALDARARGRDRAAWTGLPSSRDGSDRGIPTVFTLPSGRVLAISVRVCSEARPCRSVGTAVAAVSLQLLVAEAGARLPPPSGVTLFSSDGDALASSGVTPPPVPVTADGSWRVKQSIDGTELVVSYFPFHVQGRQIGSLATAIPATAELASARATAVKIAAVLLLGMLLLVLLGSVLARVTFRQIRVLVDTSRSIAAGNLSARAAVLIEDELGELARSVNDMASELETSHTMLETRIEAATKEVRRLLRERTEFFASLSHELRTPLAVILSESRMMLDPRYRRRAQATAWRSVEGSAAHLLDVVNAILELARAEWNRLEMQITDVDVVAMLDDMEPAVRTLAANGGLHAVVERPDRLPAVKADGARLKQVLLNLVDNAVKYTPAGGNVHISAAMRNGHVDIHVSDDGYGIPEEAGERIFEPFFRVPGSTPARDAPSTGLGLALARRLVDAQGGTLSYRSRPGSGTTFTVSFMRTGAGEASLISETKPHPTPARTT